MILSKVMHSSDYDNPQLGSLGKIITDTVNTYLGGWDSKHHQHRLWEYEMALAAMQEAERLQKRNFHLVADVGGGTGYLSPVLLHLFASVVLYEQWQFGDERAQARRQLEAVTNHENNYGVKNGFQDSVNGYTYDAIFCLSTLEHVEDDYGLLAAMAKAVNPGGLLFLTVDFAPDDNDHYAHAGMRKRIYNQRTLQDREFFLTKNYGFKPLGGTPDWNWDESCRLVHDYGFASLAMMKELEK